MKLTDNDFSQFAKGLLPWNGPSGLNFNVPKWTDADLLFRWRNDPEVIVNSATSKPLIWQSHLEWFDKSLKSAKRLILLAKYEGIPAGLLRFDLHENQCEFTWSVAREFRGKGVGKQIVKDGVCFIVLLNSYRKFVAEIIAKVRVSNARSQKVAEGANLKLESEADGFRSYHLIL